MRVGGTTLQFTPYIESSFKLKNFLIQTVLISNLGQDSSIKDLHSIFSFYGDIFSAQIFASEIPKVNIGMVSFMKYRDFSNCLEQAILINEKNNLIVSNANLVDDLNELNVPDISKVY